MKNEKLKTNGLMLVVYAWHTKGKYVAVAAFENYKFADEWASKNYEKYIIKEAEVTIKL